MKRSDKQILTTHVGSLIRPPELIQFLRAKRNHDSYDEDDYQRCLADSVAEIVRHQAKIGLDVISDGEFGKSISWSQYVLERLAGFEFAAEHIGPRSLRLRRRPSALSGIL